MAVSQDRLWEPDTGTWPHEQLALGANRALASNFTLVALYGSGCVITRRKRTTRCEPNDGSP